VHRGRSFRALSILLLLAALASACSNDADPKRQVAAEQDADRGASTSSDAPGDDDGGASGSSRDASSDTLGHPSKAAEDGGPLKIDPPSGTKKLIGVTDKEITVAYYWKGDRTRASPYLRGTGVDALLDEAEAFRAWIEYINEHADGGGDIMGFPFDLHGRKLRGVVIEAGNSAEDNVASVTDIKAAKPFAAVAAHGSVSTYACPLLADAGIFNLWTYDLDYDLAGRSKGWCLPGGATFDAQSEVMKRYLTGRVADTKTSSGAKRVFGVLYAEYPGLTKSAQTFAKELKAAGLNVPVVRSISAELSEAQQQSMAIAPAFRAAGVNTMIIPDAGAPISFTAAAQAIGWNPDYVVWPCSGQDAPAMVRLYTGSQWDGATGLTCYAQDFMIDLRHGGANRTSEWFKKYTSTGRSEAPSQAPFVYAGLLPLVAGITGAGRDLTPERFSDALERFPGYRYAAASGKTSRTNHMHVAVGEHAHPLVDDFTVLRWESSAPAQGGGNGAYEFPESGRRYTTSHHF